MKITVDPSEVYDPKGKEWKARVVELEAKLARIKPWLQHQTDLCEFGCRCGLEKALEDKP